MEWKEVYKFPLKVVEATPFVAVTNDNKHAFDFVSTRDCYVPAFTVPYDYAMRFVNVINGENKTDFAPNFTYDNGFVYFGELPVIRVRGWGYLTGKGKYALGLNGEDAVRLQNEFGGYIADKLNGKQ